MAYSNELQPIAFSLEHLCGHVTSFNILLVKEIFMESFLPHILVTHMQRAFFAGLHMYCHKLHTGISNMAFRSTIEISAVVLRLIIAF